MSRVPSRGSKAWFAREWRRVLRKGARSENVVAELARLSYENQTLRRRLAEVDERIGQIEEGVAVLEKSARTERLLSFESNRAEKKLN